VGWAVFTAVGRQCVKYARTQDLYKVSAFWPNMFEGFHGWKNRRKVSPQNTTVFYKELWGSTPDINMPFDPTTPGNKDLSA